MRRSRLTPRRRATLPFVYWLNPAREAKLLERKLAAEREMWAYDNLPAPLRREVARAAIAPNTQEIREKLYALAQRLRMSERDVAELMVAAMPEAEIEKIQQFAADYRQRYGVELPHVAAGATVLR